MCTNLLMSILAGIDWAAAPLEQSVDDLSLDVADEQPEEENSKVTSPKSKKVDGQKPEPYVNKDRFKTGGAPRVRLIFYVK